MEIVQRRRDDLLKEFVTPSTARLKLIGAYFHLLKEVVTSLVYCLHFPERISDKDETYFIHYEIQFAIYSRACLVRYTITLVDLKRVTKATKCVGRV